jgi:hypothetical protein
MVSSAQHRSYPANAFCSILATSISYSPRYVVNGEKTLASLDVVRAEGPPFSPKAATTGSHEGPV